MIAAPYPHNQTLVLPSSPTDNVSCAKRITLHWRVIPGLLALVSCIIGIACSLLVWNTPYLAIPFSIGTLSSGYMSYLGYQYHHLKSYAKNNENYKQLNQANLQQINYFSQQNTILREAINTLLHGNEKFQSLLASMEKNMLSLDASKDSFQATATNLQTQMKELNTIKGETQNEVATLLKSITRFLNNQENHTDQFFTSIADQIKQQMSQQHQCLKNLGDNINKNVELVLGASEKLGKEITHLQSIISLQEQAQKKLGEAQNNLATTEGKLAATQKGFENIHEKFKITQKKLNDTENKLTTAVNRLTEYPRQSSDGI